MLLFFFFIDTTSPHSLLKVAWRIWSLIKDTCLSRKESASAKVALRTLWWDTTKCPQLCHAFCTGCGHNINISFLLQVSRKAEFSLGSSLSADLAGFSLADNVTVSLGFRSTENQGLILQDKQRVSTSIVKVKSLMCCLCIKYWPFI